MSTIVSFFFLCSRKLDRRQFFASVLGLIVAFVLIRTSGRPVFASLGAGGAISVLLAYTWLAWQYVALHAMRARDIGWPALTCFAVVFVPALMIAPFGPAAILLGPLVIVLVTLVFAVIPGRQIDRLVSGVLATAEAKVAREIANRSNGSLKANASGFGRRTR